MPSPTTAAPDPRLLRAVTLAVAEQGYRQTTVADVIRVAGVGRNSFYSRFSDKEQCFLTAYEEILAAAVRTVREATEEPGGSGVEPRLAALFAHAARQPQAARAALIESHAAGGAASVQRERAMAALTAMLRPGVGAPARGGGLAEQVPSAVYAGIETLLMRRAREGRSDELPGLASDVATWVAGYAVCFEPDAAPVPLAPPARPSRRRGQAPGSLIAVGPSGRRGLPPGPKRAPRDFIAQNLRDRMLDAIATIAGRDGYDAVTVQAIVTAAETSKRSFYEHFTSVPEAFEATVLLGAEGIMTVVLPAYAGRPDWDGAIVAALVALCRFLDEEPAFARTGLVEALSAGAGAIGVRDQVIAAIAGSLSDAYRRSELVADPVLTGELVAGAAMTLCARAVANGRAGKLYALAPTLAYLALVPAAGTHAAAAAISAYYDEG